MTASNSAASFGPTWFAATMVAAAERARLAGDLDVDVCVIGGGLAGVTIAREVARRGWSVIVLEARRIAWNASGRNAGFVVPGFAERIEAIIERVGLDRARELWRLSVEGVNYVRAAIRESGMPGLDPVNGFVRVAKADDEDGMLRHVAVMHADFGADVEMWPTDRVRDVLRSASYFQATHWPRAFRIHPLNYALGLASAAERSGARICEHTVALAIDISGVRKRVDTEGGRIRANHIVLAGGAHLGTLFPAASGTVIPVASYVAATAPLGERLREAIGYSGAVADARLGGDYYRVVDGDRLLWGTGISTRIPVPRGVGDRIARRIAEVYPQLGTVEVAQTWSGAMCYAVHKMPQIGEVAPGVWLANAFGGHGLNTTAMAGELIARAIIEGDDRWRLFSPYELVWAGGSAGRAAAQLVFWAAQGLEAAGRALARYRETHPTAGGAAVRPQGQAARARAPRRPTREDEGLGRAADNTAEPVVTAPRFVDGSGGSGGRDPASQQGKAAAPVAEVPDTELMHDAIGRRVIQPMTLDRAGTERLSLLAEADSTPLVVASDPEEQIAAGAGRPSMPRRLAQRWSRKRTGGPI